MKKTKKNILLLLAVMSLMLLSVSACNKSDKKEATKKEDININVEEKEKEKEKNKTETQIKEDKAKKEAEDKAKKEAEDKAKKEAEDKAKKEAEDKAKKEAEDKAKKEAEDKAKKEAEDKAQENTASGKLGFNDNESQKLRDEVNNMGMTLIEDDNQERSTVPTEGLEAIATFENSESYGWICKYDDNRIGVAQIIKDSPIKVVRIYGEEAIFHDGGNSIVNNDPELYKEASERIADTFFQGQSDTVVKKLY